MQFCAIRQAVPIGVWIQRIGPMNQDFVTIVQTITVGIGIGRIGGALKLVRIIEAITIVIGGGGGLVWAFDINLI